MHIRFTVTILILSSVKTLQNFFLYQTLSPMFKSKLYCKNDDKTYTLKIYI